MRFIHVYIHSIYINNANWVLNSAATKGRKAASSWPTTRCHIHTHRRAYIICTYTHTQTQHTQLHCSVLCENNKQSATQKGISTSIHTHIHTPRSICASVCALHWRARSHCTLASSWESKTQTQNHPSEWRDFQAALPQVRCQRQRCCCCCCCCLCRDCACILFYAFF